MKLRLIIGIFWILCAVLQAQGDSLLFKSQRYNSVQSHLLEQIYANPALKYISVANLTDLKLYGQTKNQNKNLVSYLGKDEDSYGFVAKGNRHLDKLELWGEASYDNSQVTTIEWGSVASPEFIYPYFLADTLSADAYNETYQFTGGFRKLYSRSVLGAETKYKAGSMHTKLDPRALNEEMDVGLKVGYARTLESKQQLGLYGQFNYYRQTSELRAFTENRKDQYYFLKGFGQYHRGMSGSETSEKVEYRAHSFNGGVDWKISDRNILFQLQYKWIKLNQNYSNLNPFYANNQLFCFAVTKSFVGDKQSLLWNWQNQWETKKGTENIYEWILVNEDTLTNTKVYDSRILSSISRFRSNKISSEMQWVYQSRKLHKLQNEWELTTGYLRYEEVFYDPDLNYNFSALKLGLAQQLNFLRNKSSFTLFYNVNYKYILDKQSNLLESNMPEKVFAMDVENISSDLISAQIGARIELKIKDKQLFFIQPKANYFQTTSSVIGWGVYCSTGFIL